MERVPLFVTRHSLSQRSAIGVQTRQFAQANEDWLHFHWWTSENRRQDQRSVLLEHWLLSRYALFKRGRVAQTLNATLRLSKWRDSHLCPAAARLIKERYAKRVSCIYVAPLDRDDAIRCRSIVQTLNRPFVLQVWDYLDGGPECEEHRWLIANAVRVFCLSQPARDTILPQRPDTEELLFFRAPSRFSASSPSGGQITISLSGDLGSYSEGLDILDAAIDLLHIQGIEARVQYAGSARGFARVRSALIRRAKVSGFLTNMDDFDHALAHGNVAFLSGPLAAPATDLRSRFSIPSRTLDYLAVGAPIVGTVNPDSATGIFLRRFKVDSGAFTSTAHELANVLTTLLVKENWLREREKSLAAFAGITRVPAPIVLREAMSAIGATS